MYILLLTMLFSISVWGQGLKLYNTKRDTIVIKQGERFILNGLQHILKKVDYQNQTMIVKRRPIPRVFFPFSAVNLFHRDTEIRLRSIRSLKYTRYPFNIMGILMGGGFGGYLYFYTNIDYGFSELLGISYVSAGIVYSITEPTFSKKIIFSDNEWSIVND